MGQAKRNPTALAVARGEAVCLGCKAPLGRPQPDAKTAALVERFGQPLPKFCAACIKRREEETAAREQEDMRIAEIQRKARVALVSQDDGLMARELRMIRHLHPAAIGAARIAIKNRW